jgi:hypothetical protein
MSPLVDLTDDEAAEISAMRLARSGRGVGATPSAMAVTLEADSIDDFGRSAPSEIAPGARALFAAIPTTETSAFLLPRH